MEDEYGYFDFFVGYVPPRAIFLTRLHGIQKIVTEPVRQDSSSEFFISSAIEVCTIGLASYFEAFCKEQFAAIINIAPHTLEHFARERPEFKVGLPHLVRVMGSLPQNLGFLIAEELDFGTGKKVNVLFFHLLGVTPFSEDDLREYDRFIDDRNLIVHHSGVYTYKYLQHRNPKEPNRGRPYADSLLFSQTEFERNVSFLTALAEKISTTTHSALNAFILSKGIELSVQQRKAIEALLWN